MRKISIIVVTLVLISATSAHSQVLIGLLFGDKLNNPKMEFGINIFANYSSISDIENSEFHRGLGLGLFLDYKINDKWVLAFGGYAKSPRGVKNFTKEESFSSHIHDSVFLDATTKRTMNYLELPILIRYNVFPQIGIAFGFDVGVLTGASEFIYYSGNHGDITYETNIRDNYNRINFEVLAGLNYHFKGNPGSQIRFNYMHGLTNIYQEETGREGYHRVFQLGVLVPIKFGLVSKVEGELE